VPNGRERWAISRGFPGKHHRRRVRTPVAAISAVACGVLRKKPASAGDCRPVRFGGGEPYMLKASLLLGDKPTSNAPNPYLSSYEYMHKSKAGQ
jgi:hypothetical protein